MIVEFVLVLLPIPFFIFELAISDLTSWLKTNKFKMLNKCATICAGVIFVVSFSVNILWGALYIQATDNFREILYLIFTIVCFYIELYLRVKASE